MGTPQEEQEEARDSPRKATRKSEFGVVKRLWYEEGQQRLDCCLTGQETDTPLSVPESGTGVSRCHSS